MNLLQLLHRNFVLNIFYLDKSPMQCAEWMVDKHVTKMIVETSQLLSTAHRLLDGDMIIQKNPSGRKMKRWMLDDDRNDVLYLASHIKHPSAIWCMKTNNNYDWLYCHLLELIEEYKYRYGNKKHKTENLLQHLKFTPNNIDIGPFTQPTPAMDDVYKISKDSIVCYRNYYKYGKKHLHSWKNRKPPEWIQC